MDHTHALHRVKMPYRAIIIAYNSFLVILKGIVLLCTVPS